MQMLYQDSTAKSIIPIINENNMANICTNTLTAFSEESQEDFDEFKKLALARGNELRGNMVYPLLGNLVPAPDVEQQNEDWFSKYWGTAKEVEAFVYDEDDTESLTFEFESAGYPPLSWFKSVAERFPNLTFKLNFDEEGDRFMGIAVGKNGEFSHHSLDY